MLYDPKWNEQKVDPYSVAGLIGWLERQPSDGSYDWDSIGCCLVAQYLKSIGIEYPAAEFFFHEALGKDWPYNEIAGVRPWTFGAALGRARALTKGQ